MGLCNYRYTITFCYKSRFCVQGQATLPSVSDDAALEDDVDPKSSCSSSRSVSNEDLTAIGDKTKDLSLADIEGVGMETETGVTEALVRDLGSQVPEVAMEDLLDPDDNMQVSMTTIEDYSGIEIGDVESTADDSKAMSHSSSMDTLGDLKDEEIPGEKSAAADDDKSISEEMARGDIDVSEAIQGKENGGSAQRPGDIGSLLDNEVPLVYCTRLLCSQFLLTGYDKGLIPDRQVRVSVKALALGCTASILGLYPRIFAKHLHIASPAAGEALQHRNGKLLLLFNMTW